MADRPTVENWLNKQALIDLIRDEDVAPLGVLYTIKSVFMEAFDVLEERFKEQADQLKELPQLRLELIDKQKKCAELAQKVHGVHQVCQHKEERCQEKTREANRLHTICELNNRSILGSPIKSNMVRPSAIHSIFREPSVQGTLRIKRKKDGVTKNSFMGMGYNSRPRPVADQQSVESHDRANDSRNRIPKFTSLIDDGVFLSDDEVEYQGTFRNPVMIDSNSEHRQNFKSTIEDRLTRIGSVLGPKLTEDKPELVDNTSSAMPANTSGLEDREQKVFLVGQRNKVASDCKNAWIQMKRDLTERDLQRIIAEPGPTTRKLHFGRRRMKVWPHEDSFKRRV